MQIEITQSLKIFTMVLFSITCVRCFGEDVLHLENGNSVSGEILNEIEGVQITFRYEHNDQIITRDVPFSKIKGIERSDASYKSKTDPAKPWYLGDEKSITGPATVERKGQMMNISITSVRNGVVKARGNLALHEYFRGEITKIWLHSYEAVEGIADPLRKKFSYDIETRKFTKRPLPPTISLSSWKFQQDSQTITETTVKTVIVGGIVMQEEVPETYIVYAGTATAGANITNTDASFKTVKMVLSVNEGTGFVNVTETLNPNEEKLINVDFPTQGKQVTSVKLADFEISS